MHTRTKFWWGHNVAYVCICVKHKTSSFLSLILQFWRWVLFSVSVNEIRDATGNNYDYQCHRCMFLLYLWKKVLCFFTTPLCLSVCLSVCVCVCVCVSVIRIVTRWLHKATRYYVRLSALTTAQHCNIIKMIRSVGGS